MLPFVLRARDSVFNHCSTAMGLIAAIPAVWAYNRYQTKLERISTRYDTFVEEFSSILQRQTHGDDER